MNRLRVLAIAIGAVAALGAAFAAAAVLRHGDEARNFGWTVVRSDSGFMARVAPDGPAAGLLRDTPTPISQIAATVGYTDAFHFSRVFRRVMGAAPRAWRQSLRHQT